MGTMSRAYFNEMAGGWDRTAAETDHTKLQDMVRRLDLRRGAVILDVGSGTGVLLPFLQEAIGRTGRILAVDFAELMLRQALRKNPGDNVTYLLADAGHIPVCSESVDAVVCYSSFPHFPGKPAVLREMYRVLRGGGRLLVCHTSSREQINAIHRGIPAVRHDLLPDNTEMRLMMTAAGFTSVRIEDRSDSYLAVAEKLPPSSRLMSSTFGE